MAPKTKKDTEKKAATAETTAATESEPRKSRRVAEKKTTEEKPSKKDDTKKGGVKKQSKTTEAKKGASTTAKKAAKAVATTGGKKGAAASEKKTASKKGGKKASEETKKGGKSKAKKETKKKVEEEEKKITKKGTGKKKTKRSAAKKKSTTPKPAVGEIEEGKLDSVFAQLPVSSLVDICEALHVTKHSNSRGKNVEEIMKWCTIHGERYLVDEADKEVLRAVLTDFNGKEPETDARGKMQQELRELLKTHGQEAVFQKMKIETVDKLCAVFDFEEEGDKGEKVNALLEEIVIHSAKDALNKMNKEFVSEFAATVGLPKSLSKDSLIHKIIALAFPHMTEEEETEPKKKKGGKKGEEKEVEKEEEKPVEKKPIEKGISQMDLYQYYVEDLVEYCKKNNIKHSGSKKDVIKRILTFLEDPSKAEKPGDKKQKPQKKKKAEKKTSGTKRKADEASTSTAAAETAAADKTTEATSNAAEATTTTAAKKQKK